MSSPKYASPLVINIIPSRWLTAVVLFMHLGAALLLVILDLSFAIKLALIALLVTSAVVVAYYLGWVCSGNKCKWLGMFLNRWPRFVRVIWDSDDHWQLIDDGGNTHDAMLLATTVVHPKLVVVNLRLPGMGWYSRYRSLVFLPDNIDPQSFRRLRIRLRWYSPQALESSVGLK